VPGRVPLPERVPAGSESGHEDRHHGTQALHALHVRRAGVQRQRRGDTLTSGFRPHA